MALSDGQLLEQFASRREETAFEALLARHGPMVWGVCLRALGHRQEAEDAFQATFLVLARRASAIRRREAVGGWLHAVARRLAIKLKLSDHARRAREQAASDQAASVRGPDDLLTQVAWREIRTALDEELGQMPEKYRLPLVICYLEGKTHEEAADELGWPSGSMSKRLARAGELLRERLTRRGFAFSTALVTGALADHGASAVPPALVTTTLRAATACITGKIAGAIAPPVLALTEGVLAAMFLTKLKIAAAVVVALGLGIGLVSYGALGGGQRPVPGSVPVPKGGASETPFVIGDQGRSDAAEKKESPRPFITEIIDPEPKHTLTFPSNYGCILNLRERPIRWEVAGSPDVYLEPIGKGKQFLLKTHREGTAVCLFWFDNPQRWNFQEDVFSLLIRVDQRRPTAKPIDPMTYKDVPLIASIIPPGELTIVRNHTRLLILKEALHKFEPEQSNIVGHKLVTPKQLLLVGWGGPNPEIRQATEVLTLWFPANPDPEQIEVVNYLVHIVDDSKEQKATPDAEPADASGPRGGGGTPSAGQSQSIADLAKAARDAANEAYKGVEKDMQDRSTIPNGTAPWSRRILEAELEIAKDHVARVAAYEAHAKRMRDLDDWAKKVHAIGQLTAAQYAEARFFHAEAELWLAKEKAK
jgi:RNA polymerase sigma factor (sigma-70 family)